MTLTSEFSSWKKLNEHYSKTSGMQMRDLFAADKDRFSKYSVQFKDILVDYSKNRITDETMSLLIALAEEAGLKQAIEDMFSGKKINKHTHHQCETNTHSNAKESIHAYLYIYIQKNESQKMLLSNYVQRS